MKTYKKIFLYVLIPIFTQISVSALEYNSLNTTIPSFSDNSLIMKSLQKQETINQEQRDILTSKKLTLTTACLFDQIKKNNIENVKLLLDFKLNPNVSYLSDYPLYYAAKLKRSEIAKLLIEYNAKPDKGFYSELFEAVRHKDNELAQLLLDKGARVNYQDAITSNSILYYALKNNMYDIAQQLILKGAYPDKKSVQIIKKRKLYNLIPDKTN